MKRRASKIELRTNELKKYRANKNIFNRSEATRADFKKILKNIKNNWIIFKKNLRISKKSRIFVLVKWHDIVSKRNKEQENEKFRNNDKLINNECQK